MSKQQPSPVSSPTGGDVLWDRVGCAAPTPAAVLSPPLPQPLPLPLASIPCLLMLCTHWAPVPGPRALADARVTVLPQPWAMLRAAGWSPGKSALEGAPWRAGRGLKGSGGRGSIRAFCQSCCQHGSWARSRREGSVAGPQAPDTSSLRSKGGSSTGPARVGGPQSLADGGGCPRGCRRAPGPQERKSRGRVLEEAGGRCEQHENKIPFQSPCPRQGWAVKTRFQRTGLKVGRDGAGLSHQQLLVLLSPASSSRDGIT